MKSNLSEPARFEQALVNIEKAQKCGAIGDELVQDLWRRSLHEGRSGDKARAILGNMLTGPAILASFVRPAEPPEPEVPDGKKLIIGTRSSCGILTGMALLLMKMHLLLQGPSGTGKTTVIWNLIRQLVSFGVGLVFFDLKNEGRKLLRRYPGEVILLRISDIRENILKPVGDPKQYYTSFWSEFARWSHLRRETVVKLVNISLRIFAGLLHGTPHPSLHDFACILHRMAITERDNTLETAATALDSIVSILGPCALVREGQCAEDMFLVVVVECHGLPQEFLQFFTGIWLLRTHVKAIGKGHSDELCKVLLFDEGGIAFAKELSTELGSGYITPQKKMITQLRSAGIGLVIGTQSVSGIDSAVVANVGSFLCLGARKEPDVRVSTSLLLLPDDGHDVRRIARWKGLFRSPEHEAPVMIDLSNEDMGSYLGDEDVASLNAASMSRLNNGVVLSPVSSTVINPIRYTDILGETLPPEDANSDTDTPFDIRSEHREFVAEIVAHPNASIVEHYANLGWSAGRGTRVKAELLDNVVLVSERQLSVNGRPIERLGLSDKGRRLFLDE